MATHNPQFAAVGHAAGHATPAQAHQPHHRVSTAGSVSSEMDDEIGQLPQALDILASLTSLGIAPTLRDKVQQALVELTHATAAQLAAVDGPRPSVTGSAVSAGNVSSSGRAGGTPASAAREVALQRKVAELEQKMAMSRSIMKKLYQKSVALEKEAAVIKVCGAQGKRMWHARIGVTYWRRASRGVCCIHAGHVPATPALLPYIAAGSSWV